MGLFGDILGSFSDDPTTLFDNDATNFNSVTNGYLNSLGDSGFSAGSTGNSITGSLNSALGTNLTGSQFGTIGKDAFAIGGSLLSGSGGGSYTTGAQETSVRRGQAIANALDKGTISPTSRLENKVPIHSRNDFQQVDSVDPFTLENEWNNRLATYAGVVRNTGVSQQGK